MSETGAIELTQAMLEQHGETVRNALEAKNVNCEPHKFAAMELVYGVGLPVLLDLARCYKNECLSTCHHACRLGYGSPQCYVQKGECDVRTEVRRVDLALWKAGVRT